MTANESKSQSSHPDHKLDHSLHDDDSLWGSSPEEQNNLLDLDREWQRRHDQFHTIGYRDGLTAGKEASAQEGFNIGFKESVVAGYNWGLVRGITSVFTSLPDGLRKRLMEAQDDRDKMQSLHESVLALSTADSLKLFHDEDVSMKRSAEETVGAEVNPHMAGSQSQSSSTLNSYFGELKSLILKHPAIQVNLEVDQ
ncbi:protein YAE1-like isoform X2 [Diospyros lotus]|uniref:protein YAE1-like isoform X2 n=1 Tax=Diospyros lotus TaxID=55363 RepID=UPI002251E204|nr:protein YAE1-like isoform X2 [Diospyros lotus]